MTRKHNTRHERGRSNYKRRLRARGLSRTPEMTPWNPELLARAQAREATRPVSSERRAT